LISVSNSRCYRERTDNEGRREDDQSNQLLM
jgi:hypothetical protein